MNERKPIRYGNVKKIEVSVEVFKNLFIVLDGMSKELDAIRVSIGSLSHTQNDRIEKLTKAISSLQEEIKHSN